ncbi:ISPsy24, transposase orfA [Pseudomonas syringae BRIP39023]|nr:ISPsy24, transposase orfA [Pseudomonas syringae BRIP39023]
MTKQRRTFSAEFKREAAGLVLDQGYSHIEAARSLGVVESALRHWASQLQQERNCVMPQSKALTPEQQKIQELEARNTVLAAIGSKTYSISLDGSLSTPTSIIETIGKIGENSNISLSNSRFINADAMPQTLASVGAKKFAITFDASDFTVPYLKSFVASAGPNTSITLTTPQVLTTSDLLEILTLNGDRKLTLEFNGRQLSVDPVNGDKLQQVVAAANTSHTISVNTMQYPPLSYILPIIQSSANTNMVLSYNGSQLTDTEAQGMSSFEVSKWLNPQHQLSSRLWG